MGNIKFRLRRYRQIRQINKIEIQSLILLAVVAYQAAACHKSDFGKIQSTKIQILEFGSVIKEFQKDTSRFPTTAEGLDALVHNPGNLRGWNGPYLKKGVPLDPWGIEYIYKYPGDHGLFDLYSCGPDRVAGTDDDIMNWERVY